jgi:pimeloyl-ACP methyl ester carboxylesterase
VVLVAAVLIGGMGANTPQAQTTTASTFFVFFRSTLVGNEQISVERTGDGWVINGSGRIGPPFDLITRALRARYDAEWQPLDLWVDATFRGQSSTVQTSVTGTTATNALTPFGGETVTNAQEIASNAVLLPNPFVAPYEALAARLRTAGSGSSIGVYQPGQGSFDVAVGDSSTEQIKTVERTISARRTRITFQPPNVPPLGAEIWGDESGRLLRVSIPAQGLEFAREDVASVSTRLVTMSRPNDEDVFIPANGFSLAGTISKPANPVGRLPAVVLISGSGLTDRDENLFGIPIFGQIAGAVADAGYLVLRYDKRGIGQSGGRTETVRLADFADDARSAVRAVSNRKDVDRRRIAVIGHSEGGWVAMMVAAKEDRVSAVALMATAAVTGRELNLYQVTHGLERSNRSEADRQATIELQKQIHEAVVTGAGWDRPGISDAIRRQADTPYFQSFLTLDPARLMKDVHQPVLIVQGDRDTQVPPSNVERLETLAKARNRNARAEVVKVPGINHLLVPAATGEVDEYARLMTQQVSPGVTTPIIEWLNRTISARR